jgi:amino-acid N-acetyltransferase
MTAHTRTAPNSPVSSTTVPAAAGDLDLITQLLAANDLPTADLDAAQVVRFRCVRDERGQVLACAGLERLGDVALLRSVAVAVHARRRGLARALVAALEADARQLKLTTLYLLTTAAAGYFARLGFSRIAREDVPPVVRASHEFSTLCPISAIVMQRVLGESIRS